MQDTPEFQVNGPRDKPRKPKGWLEIEAEVEVETTDPSGVIPEMKAEWFAVIMDHAKRSDNPKPSPVRLTGVVTYRNVDTEKRGIYLSAYVEPSLLKRLTLKPRPSDNDIEGLAVRVSGPGFVTTGKYGEEAVMANAKEETKWWDKWTRATLQEGIVPKSQTPFAPLWTDYYPTEKIKGR